MNTLSNSSENRVVGPKSKKTVITRFTGIPGPVNVYALGTSRLSIVDTLKELTTQVFGLLFFDYYLRRRGVGLYVSDSEDPSRSW